MGKKTKKVSKVQLPAAGTIGTPHMGSLPGLYVKSLMSLIKPTSVSVQMIERVMVHYARNIIVKNMTGDWLCWIDSDMVFPPATLQVLLKKLEKSYVDIVGALCFKRIMPYTPTMYKYLKEDDKYSPILSWKPGEMVEVDAIGCGFTLVRRKVYNELKEPYYEWLGKSKRGEDISFCQKAKKAGFRIWCDTSAIVGHLSDQVVGMDHFRLGLRTEMAKRGIYLPSDQEMAKMKEPEIKKLIEKASRQGAPPKIHIAKR